MKAEDKSFYFLDTPSYYDIPFFQRAYVWDYDNWSELLANLTSKNQNHFLGSIILKNELATSGNVSRFSVIDGQQRLTTLSVLLRACYDHIVKNAGKYGYDQDVLKTCQVKMENLLFVPEGGIKQTLHVKINHSHLDRPVFENVIKGGLAKADRWEKYVNLPEGDNTSGIIKAYAYFRDELQELSPETIDYLWELLTVDKIKFLVNIDLDMTDNEQAIFDTVNSAGVRLSSADTIKNLLYQKYVELLRASNCSDVDREAVEKYESAWANVFLADENVNRYWETQRQYGRMKRSNIETFLHAFAVVEGFFNPAENNMADLPMEYKKKIAGMDKGALDLFLDELHDYADVYKDYFSDGSEELGFDDYIGRVLNICNVLEVSTFYPYLLQQLYAWKKESVTETDLRDRLFEIERYVILNAICKGSTKNYNNECLQMVEGRKTPKEIMSSSIYISESDFSAGLRRMTTNKLPTLLLFWMELYDRNFLKVDVKSLKYEYTLEHIMPQKWMQNWQDVTAYDRDGSEVEDSEEIERVRGHAIYEIGNMTLLNAKLNTSISNSAFSDKVNGKHGKDGIRKLADLRLTREVVENHAEWDERKIYARTAAFEDKIRKIWDAGELPKEIAVKSAGKDGGRKELRLKFWEKALPIIREKNNNECYANVAPTTSNESYGHFGIGGFKMICVANYDGARVDFMLGKSEPDKNKKAYDILNSHRTEIEETVGTKLHWDKADEYNSSWISYRLDGVSITNADDWDRMANFLGEWSAKLRRVLLPYLQEEFPQSIHGERSPKETEKLLEIAQILKEWMASKSEIIGWPERSSMTTVKFTTETMSRILPDTPEALSGWNTPNHYFYEIVNRNTTYVVMQLSFNSKNLSQEQRITLNKINDIVEMKQAKADWQWWKGYKADKIAIPKDLDQEIIFSNLDKALEQILEFERKLEQSL